MEFLLDDSSIEPQYKEILKTIRLYKSGEVAANLKSRGINYKINWGVSITDLRKIASHYAPSHLLALKLWNKQWRETMILATLLDEPGKVTEQQMDFWTKSFENIEIAEQASANLWWRSPYAYIKALEWCRGKKHWLRYTAIHLIGRLARMDEKSPDEMFEPFFEELVALAKDDKLSTVIERSLLIVARRSDYLKELVSEFVVALKDFDLPVAKHLAGNIEAGL
jgi:hypothetical protein